jgi:VanZ family protein
MWGRRAHPYGDEATGPVKQTYNARCAWATVVIVAGIIYASLFPFQFHRPAGIRSPVETLLSTWNLPPGRGDLAANVLFYMPFGLFASLALAYRAAAIRAGLVTAAGAALSLCMEFLQIYDAGRDPAISDICANTAGTALGVLAAALIVRRRGAASGVKVKRHPFAFMLMAFWLAFELFPYVPVIDLHKYWSAVKPLIFSPQVSAVHACYLAACWLAVAAMINEIAGVRTSRRLTVLLSGVVLGGRMLISGIALLPDEVIGAGAAVAAWIIMVSRVRHRAVIVAIAITAAAILRGLAPFTFQAPPQDFGWIPFRAFIYGAPDLSAPSFFQKTFLYGALVWAIVRAGLKFHAAAGLAAGVVFGISLAHRYMPGRSCEITDTLMVLILAGVFRVVENASAPPRGMRRSSGRQGEDSAAVAE